MENKERYLNAKRAFLLTHIGLEPMTPTSNVVLYQLS